MKVTNDMIVKDLRKMGAFSKIILDRFPKNLIKPKPTQFKPQDKSKTPYNEYILRKDTSILRLLIHKEKFDKPVPGVLWIHGGGYSTGNPEMIKMSMAKEIVKSSVVVAVDYRLSTQAPYPAALDDCYQALLWMKDHALELNINPDQIFVGGESAGGGLTVALCLLARDRGEVNIACQIPLYPMIDNRTTSSMKDNDAPIWNEQQNIKAWNLYLKDVDPVTKYAVPALETDYSNLPPAITFVGDIEPFFDETVQFIENLKRNNIEVHFEVFKGCYHTFDIMVPKSSSTKNAIKFFNDSYNYAISHYFKKQN